MDRKHLWRVESIRRRRGFNWESLRLPDVKIVDQAPLEEEVKAVTAHPRTNHNKSVVSLGDHQLPRTIVATPVIELPGAQETREVGESLPIGSVNLIYK